MLVTNKGHNIERDLHYQTELDHFIHNYVGEGSEWGSVYTKIKLIFV